MNWLDILAQTPSTELVGEAGKNAMYITIATLAATTITLIVKSILESRERRQDREMLRDVKRVGEQPKATGEVTHDIVNSQRTEMMADMKKIREELALDKVEASKRENAFKDQIRELTKSRDIARDSVQTETKRDA